MTKVKKTLQEWQAELTPEQFQVCRLKGTESPFSGQYYNCHEEGVYRCACCNAELFSSEEKYDSGSGWPSYTKPMNENTLTYIQDNSHGMVRVEVKCQNCDAHLGHVFKDGPAPTGLRYCINSVALILDRNEK